MITVDGPGDICVICAICGYRSEATMGSCRSRGGRRGPLLLRLPRYTANGSTVGRQAPFERGVR